MRQGSANAGRRPLRLGVGVAITLGAAVLGLVPATALAIDNTAPSRAPTVQVGTPFSAAENNGGPDLWRLAQVVQPGETVQIAVDNTRGTENLNVCVIGATDDFGYDAEVEAACRDESRGSVGAGRSARLSLVYKRAAAQPLIRFSSYFDRVDVYTATVEAVHPVPPPVPPDTDEDGVPDDSDRCPDVEGVAPTGCPDSDEDGIPDATDQCPDARGIGPTGCPDGDGDGVPDVSDLCPALPGLPPSGCPMSPAKLEVARVKVLRSARQLDLLAPISALASGTVEVGFQAAGRTSHFNAAVDSSNRRVLLRHPITARQARLGTGIVTLTYPGDADTQPQEVRLRAASQKANLQAGRPTISDGRLQASGQITQRARGVVRLQLLYEPPGAGTQTHEYTARISNGRYSFDEPLPADVLGDIAQRGGVVHSYTLFTGYFPRRVRGEMESFQVMGPR